MSDGITVTCETEIYQLGFDVVFCDMMDFVRPHKFQTRRL